MTSEDRDIGGGWRLNRTTRELITDGRRIRLSEKPFLVLDALIAAEGRVVTREVLQQRLWSEDTFVDFENNLNSAVASVRQAFGDSARQPRFVETIPKVGYRWCQPVPTLPAAVSAVALRPGRWATTAAVGAVALCLVALTLWAPRPDTAIDPAAETAYQRGVHQHRQFDISGDVHLLAEARAALASAIELEPTYADALAADAEALIDLGFAGQQDLRESLELARQRATQALAASPRHAGAARVLAVAALVVDWNVARASTLVTQARTLDPTDGRSALAHAMILGAAGKHLDAVAAAQQAMRLDPASLFVRADLALFHLAADQPLDAAAVATDVLRASPEFEPALRALLTASTQLGRWDDAARAAQHIMRIAGAAPDDLRRVSALPTAGQPAALRRWELAQLQNAADTDTDRHALGLALRHAAVGDRQSALDLLDRSLRGHHAMLVFVRSFPEFSSLRGDPRFEAIARAVLGTDAE
jgi:DNA-binding winged helix-turn-helix (wHTH) protein/tetratricopeptide (TPR) repeat protein